MNMSFASVQNEQAGFHSQRVTTPSPDQELIDHVISDRITMQKLLEEAFRPRLVKDANRTAGFAGMNAGPFGPVNPEGHRAATRQNQF
jgi:hypothetical protein